MSKGRVGAWGEYNRRVMNSLRQREIKRLYKEASDLAVDEVVYQARHIMKHCPELSDFVMAMGSVTFKDGDNHIGNESSVKDYPGMKGYLLNQLWEFIHEWDNELRLSGAGIRIPDADSPIITDW